MLTALDRMSKDSSMQEPHLGRVRYAHRVNEDGTLDSICPHCFLTIGTSTWEADLEKMESMHVCDPDRLRHFELGERENILREPAKIVPMRRPA
jgi:hypothetical protein